MHQRKRGKICHGGYNLITCIWQEQKPAVMDFNRARYDVQILDLYQILRKMMEKQNWDVRLGKKMLEIYEKVRPLSEEEHRELSLRLTFPEKFWKLANHYYNGKKAKAPEKGMENAGDAGCAGRIPPEFFKSSVEKDTQEGSIFYDFIV